MNSFFEQFEMFALGTWSSEGGMVSRPEATTARNRVFNARMGRMSGKKMGLVDLLMAVGIAVMSGVAVPATAYTTDAWQKIQVETANVSADADTVPANYWPAAVERLRSRRSINEADYADIDSVI